MDAIGEWMALLGMARQSDLAKALGRSEARVSSWKREGIPPWAVLELNALAVQRKLTVPASLLASQSRRVA